MFSWLQKLARRRAGADLLLNDGLGLAMDWGESWLSPINARLLKLHPYLSVGELEELNATCQGAMRLGCEAVHVMLSRGLQVPSVETFAKTVRGAYPWVNDENLQRLRNQGTYYAAKVGGHAREA